MLAQVVDEVYDEAAAEAMQLKKGTVCIMIHTGSRGLGHQVSNPPPFPLCFLPLRVSSEYHYLSCVASSFPPVLTYLQCLPAATAAVQNL